MLFCLTKEWELGTDVAKAAMWHHASSWLNAVECGIPKFQTANARQVSLSHFCCVIFHCARKARIPPFPPPSSFTRLSLACCLLLAHTHLQSPIYRTALLSYRSSIAKRNPTSLIHLRQWTLQFFKTCIPNCILNRSG